jgi:hypothetical protein
MTTMQGSGVRSVCRLAGVAAISVVGIIVYLS